MDSKGILRLICHWLKFFFSKICCSKWQPKVNLFKLDWMKGKRCRCTNHRSCRRHNSPRKIILPMKLPSWASRPKIGRERIFASSRTQPRVKKRDHVLMYFWERRWMERYKLLSRRRHRLHSTLRSTIHFGAPVTASQSRHGGGTRWMNDLLPEDISAYFCRIPYTLYYIP